jgi:hypothetical protein
LAGQAAQRASAETRILVVGSGNFQAKSNYWFPSPTQLAIAKAHISRSSCNQIAVIILNTGSVA